MTAWASGELPISFTGRNRRVNARGGAIGSKPSDLISLARKQARDRRVRFKSSRSDQDIRLSALHYSVQMPGTLWPKINARAIGNLQ